LASAPRFRTTAKRNGPFSRHQEVLQRGIVLQRSGKLREAEYCYQLVLRDNPDQPDALHLMGTLAIEANKQAAAIDYFERAVRLKPKDAVYRNNLGNALVLNGDAAGGLKHLTQAVSLQPGLVDAHVNRARAFRKLGRANEACKALERALALAPGTIVALNALGETFTDLGRMDDAEKAFRAVLAQDRNQVQAIFGLTGTRKFSAADPILGHIQKLCGDTTTNDKDRSILYHAAGKVLSDAKQYDEAFRHFSEGKALQERDFALAAHRGMYASLKSLFSPMFFMERSEFGDPSELPVFIVGMPRSGTTLTEQILASHSKAHGAGELNAMRSIANRLDFHKQGNEPFRRAVLNMRVDDSRALAQRYLEFLRSYSASALRITDKMPHNFELVGLIRLLLPRAKIIHCERDALDTCVSCFTHFFSEAHRYNSDLQTLGLYYGEYADLMHYWNSVLPGRIYKSRYEELIENQEARTRGLLDFIGLEWDEACLSFQATERLTGTMSRWQVRQPIHGTSVKAWKRYEKHLGPLISALGDSAATD